MATSVPFRDLADARIRLETLKRLAMDHVLREEFAAAACYEVAIGRLTEDLYAYEADLKRRRWPWRR